MRFETKIFFMTIILNLFSCNKEVDCNRDLVYEDGITYFKGKLFSGDCNSYYNNGVKMNKQSYINGMDNGEWIFYFKNGKVETRARFKENKRHGLWTYYFDDGKTIRQISNYKNGKKDSVWIKFSGDGRVEWEKEFKNDLLINEKK